MTRTTLKPNPIHWLGFSLLQDKLWTKSGLKWTNTAFSHKPYTPKPTEQIVINNRISYSFFPTLTYIFSTQTKHKHDFVNLAKHRP